MRPFTSNKKEAWKPNLIRSLITNNHLNVFNTDGTPDPNVWAIGDAAMIQDQRLPATAQGQFLDQITFVTRWFSSAVANQKAKYLTKKLNKIVKEQESPKPFEFHNQGSLAYLGNWWVIKLVLCSSPTHLLIRTPFTSPGKRYMIDQALRMEWKQKNQADWHGSCGGQRISQWLWV